MTEVVSDASLSPGAGSDCAAETTASFWIVPSTTGFTTTSTDALPPAAIGPRAVRRPNSWFKPGELARLVLDVLRTAPAALSVREITVQVMERRGLDPQDARTAELLRKLVSNALNRQAADLVERIQDGVLVGWQVRE